MIKRSLNLSVLDGDFAICRLDADAKLPAWARGGGLVSFIRTTDELSVVCPQNNVPPGVTMDAGWRVIKVAETLDFSETGVLASLTGPLAEGGINIFALSTFDTDYIMVKESDLEAALRVLGSAGHKILQAGPQGSSGSAGEGMSH